MAPTKGDADEVIEKLWVEATSQIISIDPATENWKAQVLPLARIKKIMKSEEAIHADLDQDKATGGSTGQRFMIAGEAPVLLEKACELLVRELTTRAWRHTERCRRRTLQRQDVHAAVGENEVYDFLIDIVPRVTPAGTAVKNYATGGAAEQPQLSNANVNLEAGAAMANVATTGTGEESGMSLADAELRLAQLQQMQEQFIMMQQRMQAEAAAAGGNGNPVRQHAPQMQQMMMHPALFMHSQQQTVPALSGGEHMHQHNIANGTEQGNTQSDA